MYPPRIGVTYGNRPHNDFLSQVAETIAPRCYLLQCYLGATALTTTREYHYSDTHITLRNSAEGYAILIGIRRLFNDDIRRNYRFQYGITQGIGAEVLWLACSTSMPILSASALVKHIPTYVKKYQRLFVSTFDRCGELEA